MITANVEFRDVGTRMKITPLLGHTDIVTLIIEADLSAVQSTAAGDGSIAAQTLVTTTKSTTTTRVHVPDGYFLVFSGMINERNQTIKNRVPCLGAVPLLGALFKSHQVTDEKRNIMYFIRPQIIDTDEQIQKLTRHQQDIYRMKSEQRESWKYEVDEALDFLNMKKICDCDCNYNYEDEWMQ